MPEGLSASEVGKEIGEHAKHADPHERRDRLISISEAVLLSVVALLAAWSGYAAAKWSTESRVELATASSLRIEASRADADAFELRNFDSSTFESWFSAYIAGNKTAMRVAERRFRPEFKVAFDAWRATKPETNPEAPRGPTYMPQYKRPVWPRLGSSMIEPRQPFLTARRTARPPTSTSGSRSCWPASSSWSASRHTSRTGVSATA
jgi:hypothetical protein